jgi:predicted pyridoxine 5'-phosphate oxidase superfamily flavin-nucleotide-binding protein
MAFKFHELAFTESVLQAQEHYYGQKRTVRPSPGPDPLTHDEIDFIQARDSFYMATVSVTGWPYVQHRGGKAGFLRVLGPTQLAFADYKGNRQMISVGNLAASHRVMLFLMDYPERTRLKIVGTARVEDARQHPELLEQLAGPEERGEVERFFFIDVLSYDWNCQQHITPRYTLEEITALTAPLRQRIEELEAQLKALSPSNQSAT